MAEKSMPDPKVKKNVEEGDREAELPEEHEEKRKGKKGKKYEEKKKELAAKKK